MYIHLSVFMMRREDLARFIGFEWDDAKAAINTAKHHLSFEQAKEVFLDDGKILLPIVREDLPEDRYLVVGRLLSGEEVTVVITLRPPNIRLISARHSKKREHILYQLYQS